MSAFPPIATELRTSLVVRFVPEAVIPSARWVELWQGWSGIRPRYWYRPGTSM